MARVKTSALIADISGKLNGSVFQRTQGGLIIRNQPGKLYSNSLSANSRKIGMATVQTAWQGLTNSQRLLWQTYSVYLNKKQKHSNSLIVNGHQLFIDINSIRYDLSAANVLFQPYLLSTPILAPLPQPINLTTIFSDGIAFSVSFDRAVDATTEVVILFLSRPLIGSQISGNVKSTLMKVTTVDGFAVIPSTYYKSVFGRVLLSGDYVQTKIAIYSTASQNYSSYSVQRILVA